MSLVILLYACFASVFVLAKDGLEYAQPLFLVGSRMLMASGLLFTFLVIRREYKVRAAKGYLGKLFLLGAFNIYLTNALEFWGLQYLTSAKTCFIYSLSPFISAFLSYFILSETLTPKKWLGFAIGIIGFIPILMGQGGGEEASGHIGFLSWAEIAVMGAACSTCYGWVIMRELVAEKECCPIVANAWSMFFGGALALGHSLLVENWSPIPVTETAPFLRTAILMIVLSNLVGYNLYGSLLKKYTATFLSFCGFMTPFFTAIMGWWFLGETVSLSFLLSAAIVLVGLLLFYVEELRLEGVKIQPAVA